MLVVVALFVYVVVGLRVGVGVARAQVNEDRDGFGYVEPLGLVLAGLVGLMAGYLWPLTVVGRAVWRGLCVLSERDQRAYERERDRA